MSINTKIRTQDYVQLTRLYDTIFFILQSLKSVLSSKKMKKPAILTQKSLRFFIVLSSLPLFGIVAAFGIAPNSSFLEELPVQKVILNLPLPDITQIDNTDITLWRQERIQRGDTSASLLARLEVNYQDTTNFLLEANNIKAMRKLVPGKAIHAQTTTSGQLLKLRYFLSNEEQFLIERTADTFKLSEQSVKMETQIHMKSGVIDSSLFAATDNAGVPDSVATQIVDIFSSDIDFHRDLHQGDRFTVVYESLYANGELVQAGRVLAVEFINQKKSYQALYFQKNAENGGYYAPDGKSLRKTFLRSPLAFSRISSGFSNSRLHPVLKTWRSHNGIDYAAPTGTQIKATSDGKVAFSGWQNGYGNLIILQHQGQYSTAYGHLSSFTKGLHKGQRVNQGDVIGYVGATGMATGPHLHYEFRINGAQKDPLRVAMPAATPLTTQNMTAFHENTEPLMNRLNMLRDVSLAILD